MYPEYKDISYESFLVGLDNLINKGYIKLTTIEELGNYGLHKLETNTRLKEHYQATTLGLYTYLYREDRR